MARLTTFSKLLITLVIVGALAFLAKTYLPQLSGGGTTHSSTTDSGSSSTTTTNQTTSSGSSSSSATTSNNSAGSSTASVAPFNYTAKEPVNGKLKGVVELGASGFNSFIIRMDQQKNWKLERAEYGASLLYEKMTNDDDVRAGLKRYIGDMLAFGVSGKDIHFVISSGAKKVDITQKIIDELKKMGYVVNTVTPEQEGKLALKSCLPAEFNSKAFVVDIGSGNTKISWMTGAQVSSQETHGAKYFQNGTTDATVAQDVTGKAKMVPAANRGTCFIIGGVPFELAKQVRNGKERYTVLKAPADYKAEGEKQKAGLNIYKNIADATGCKQFVFDWDANFTIGFLLNL